MYVAAQLARARLAAERDGEARTRRWFAYDLTTPLPELRCFYEEVFEFSQFGVDPSRTATTLQAVLDDSRLV